MRQSSRTAKTMKRKLKKMKNRSTILMVIPLILVCFAFAPQTRAVSPPPDGGYPGLNTAEGFQSLQLLIGGFANTGLGWRSNFSAIGASFNVGVGAGSLVLNRADANTACG